MSSCDGSHATTTSTPDASPLAYTTVSFEIRKNETGYLADPAVATEVLRYITVAYTTDGADPCTLKCGASIFRYVDTTGDGEEASVLSREREDKDAYRKPATQAVLHQTAASRLQKNPFALQFAPTLDLTNKQEVKAALKALYNQYQDGEKRHWIVRGKKRLPGATKAAARRAKNSTGAAAGGAGAGAGIGSPTGGFSSGGARRTHTSHLSGADTTASFATSANATSARYHRLAAKHAATAKVAKIIAQSKAPAQHV